MFTYVYVYVSVSLYIHTYIHTCMHACMHAYLSVCRCMCLESQWLIIMGYFKPKKGLLWVELPIISSYVAVQVLACAILVLSTDCSLLQHAGVMHNTN